MSFHLQFVARTREAALNRIVAMRAPAAETHVHPLAVSAVEEALRAMRHDGMVSVLATGHFCDPVDPHSYEVTSLQPEARPMAASEFVDG